MRAGELAFLLLLTAYHAALLVPRRRRPFPANYLVFLAGMALAWNLGMEGLRLQTIPPLVLLLADLLFLFPTFATLRGRPPAPGVLPLLGRGLRTLAASLALLAVAGSCLLAVAFPLPSVGLTGGLTPSQRVVRFPAVEGLPGLELKLWYPAAGDTRPQPRPQAEALSWHRAEEAGGPPVFWQAYLAELPTEAVRGGKLASPRTRYPVVYVALPPGQDPDDFGYLFEDLASRGLLVAAGRPLPGPSAPAREFSWEGALADLTQPLAQPGVWLEPDRTLDASPVPTDYRWLSATRQALAQLDSEPGDMLYSAVDLKHQVLWAWGPGPALDGQAMQELDLRGQIHAGGSPVSDGSRRKPELWIVGRPAPEAASPGQWFLEVPRLYRADLSDSAYLKPYLAPFGLKAQADAGVHGVLRQYQAAFFQHALWGSGADAAFGQTVPEVPGLRLTGQ